MKRLKIPLKNGLKLDCPPPKAENHIKESMKKIIKKNHELFKRLE